MSGASRREKIVWSVVFVLAGAYFFWRGPLRALRPGGQHDFRVIHFALSTYDQGGNPYLDEDIRRTFKEAGLQGWLRGYSNLRLLYPPPVATLFGPLGRVYYEKLRPWLLGLELAAMVGLVWTAGRLGGLETRREWAALSAAALCWAPIHTSLSQGQPGVLFSLLTAVYLLTLARGSTLGVGALSVAAAMLKPSLGAPAALVGLIQGRWKTLVAGAAVFLVLSVPFLSRFSIASYRDALAAVTAPGGDADDSRANPNRAELLNLRSWLGSWELPEGVEAALYGLGIALLAAALIAYRGAARERRLQGFYWTLAAVAALLAVYHRFYDASLLLIGVAAAIRYIPLAIPLAVFLAPGGAFLRGIEGPAWFEPLVIRHQTPALLCVAAICMFQLARRMRPALPNVQRDG